LIEWLEGRNPQVIVITNSGTDPDFLYLLHFLLSRAGSDPSENATNRFFVKNAEKVRIAEIS